MVTRLRKNPASNSQLPVSRPRYGVGTRPTGLVARTTRPPAGQQIIGNLAAGLGAAHDEHRILWQQVRTAVVRGVILRDPIREGLGQRGRSRRVLVAGGDHDGEGTDVTVARLQEVPVAGGRQLCDAHTLADRAVGGELLQSLDDLRAVRVRRLLAPACGSQSPAC
jgi:hypothetical protein